MARVDRRIVIVAAALAGAAHAESGEALALSLRQAMEMAAKQNPLVQVARLRAVQAQAGVKATRSGLLPQLTLGAASGYENLNLKALGLTSAGLPQSTGALQQFDVRPTLTQTLYDPGLRKSVVAARERAEDSRWSAVSVQEETVLAVAALYLEALDFKARADAAAARLRSAEAWLQQVRRLVEEGVASRLDQSRAGIQVANERRTLVDCESRTAVKKLLLANLLGLSGDTRLELTEAFTPPRPSPVALDASVSLALERRPELKAAQARLRAARAEKEKAQSGRYPIVGVATDFGRMGNTPWDNLFTYTVRGTLRFPVLQGGRVDAEVSAADAVIRQVNEEIRSLRLQVETEVRTAAIELSAAAESYDSAADAATLAEKNVELATDRFEAGLSTDIEVVNAQESRASAEAAASRCIFDYYMARARLARAQGNLQDLFD